MKGQQVEKRKNSFEAVKSVDISKEEMNEGNDDNKETGRRSDKVEDVNWIPTVFRHTTAKQRGKMEKQGKRSADPEKPNRIPTIFKNSTGHLISSSPTPWREHITIPSGVAPKQGKPNYEISQRHPESVPSLHLEHTEVKATLTEFTLRTERQQALAENNMAPAAPQDAVGETSEMNEISYLLEENRILRKRLSQMRIDEDSFKDDDTKLMYYTGLPSLTVVKGLLLRLLPCLPPAEQKLSPFQMLLLTLMRLRLSLPVQHIAYHFCIDQRTVSTVFRDTIGALFTHLSSLVHWPERHCLEDSMPHQFVEAFGNRVAVIVECFEINIERASNLKARVQAFSHSKHTIKYLIGSTPQGTISFISKGWGGRASDKHVTENSGLLDKLFPGDLVLADHGFDIRDSVGLMCAEVKIPAFTRGRCQLEAKEATETQQVAHLRVHMERVIRCVRTKYTILRGTIPVSMVLPCEGDDMIFLDKIVFVCCALSNMCHRDETI